MRPIDPNQRQVISSSWTLVFKFLIPPMLIALSLFLLVGLFRFSVQPHSDAVIGTLMVIGAAVFFCWLGARLKQVSMDEHNLYVGGLFKEVCIPYKGIYSITDLQGGWPMIVRLREKSDFGRTILFLAEWQPLIFQNPHPILKELRQLTKQEQNNKR